MATENLFTNPGFDDTPGGATSFTGSFSGGVSAAPGWTVYNNTNGTTTTELLPSTDPNGGDRMIHIDTDGDGDGVFQLFPGPAHYGYVDVFVLSGKASLWLVSGYGSNYVQIATSTTTNAWERLTIDTGLNNTDEVAIYAIHGGANFYADNAFGAATAPPAGAPELASWAMMVLGLGGVGATLRARRGVYARACAGA